MDSEIKKIAIEFSEFSELYKKSERQFWDMIIKEKGLISYITSTQERIYNKYVESKNNPECKLKIYDFVCIGTKESPRFGRIYSINYDKEMVQVISMKEDQSNNELLDLKFSDLL